MFIGDNLRKLRERKNLSQQNVADYVGVERKTYMKWEANENDVKCQYIPKLAELFDVEIGELYRKKTSEIVINQNNTDNNHNSANGLIIILNDKETVNEVVKMFTKKLGKSSQSFSAGQDE